VGDGTCAFFGVRIVLNCLMQRISDLTFLCERT